MYKITIMIAIILFATPVWADEMISFKAGYLVLGPEGKFAVTNGGLTGTKVDLETDLSFDDSDDLLVEAALQLDAFRLSASYLPIELSGHGMLIRDIIFSGETYTVGSTVDSDVKLDIYDVGLAWYFINLDDLPIRLQAGFEVAMKYVNAEVSMIDQISGLSTRESVIAPIPTIGARCRLALGDWLGLVGRIGYLEYNNNKFLDADIQVEFSPLPLLGFFAGYRHFDLEVDESGIFIDAMFNGPYAGVLVRF